MKSVKQQVDDLAIFGGRPAFAAPLHVGQPNVGDRRRLLDRINDALDRGWLTNNGPYVGELERRISELLGVKHCIATCNGTIALEITIRALGLSGEVIVPSMTFVATAHALQWQQITPVFCDIGPDSLNIDPDRVEELITEKTTGIVGVHLCGHPCAVDRLAEIARRRNLKLLYDAAHAFHCSSGGRMVGNFGEAEVFSFHATKFFNTFEGGAVVTNDDTLAQKIRLMKNFGFAGYDRVDHIGTNGKMNEISAAMGLTNLEDIAGTIALNRRNYQLYRGALHDVDALRLHTFDETERGNYQYIVVEVDNDVLPISRDQIVEILWAENVRARRYFYPGCHRMEPYRSLYPGVGSALPLTERAVTRTMTLPTGAAVCEVSVARVCALIRFAIEHGNEIRQRFHAVRASELVGV